MGSAEAFRTLFERWARPIRARLALRHVFTGVALGLLLATLPATAAWRTRHGSWRAYAGALGAIGLVGGWLAARRRRWSDTDVALYLDDRLQAEEAITTAVGFGSESELDDPSHAVVLTTATSVLASHDARVANPRGWRRLHLLAPASAAALVAIALAPLPPPRTQPGPPGTAVVKLADVEGLQKAVALAELTARDDAQRERLDKISKDAEKLRAELTRGLETRDAQDKIARLRDEIAAERLSLGDGEHRAGLESAVAKLAEHDATRPAAKALGDHDLTTMDALMEKLANEREAADRDEAKEALDQAAKAAEQNGAPDVAKALENEKKLTDARGRRADTLRDLAKSLKDAGEGGDEVQEGVESLDRKGTDEAARKLADAMTKALDKLSPEERKRLVDKFRRQAAAKGTTQGDAETLKDFADRLSTPEGQKELEDSLKGLAEEKTDSDESKRQQALDDAQQGAAGTQDQIGEQPGAPRSGQGQGGQGQQGQSQHGRGQRGGGQEEAQQGNSPGSQGQRSGSRGQGPETQGRGDGEVAAGIPVPQAGSESAGAGGTHDTGTARHGGQTNPVAGDTLRSRAKGPLSRGTVMPSAITTYTAGGPGGTANARGTGDLRVVGPREVDGVEHSDVPEEYRDHVRQYFQP